MKKYACTRISWFLLSLLVVMTIDETFEILPGIIIRKSLILVVLMMTMYFISYCIEDHYQKKSRKEDICHKSILFTKDKLGTLSRKGISIKGKEMMDAANELIFVSIDLNNIDRLNNKFGYEEGDKVIQSFANKLIEFANEKRGIIGRWHNDVFIIIYQRDKDAAMKADILRLISNITRLESFKYDVIPSAGMYYPMPGDDFDNCVNCANIARKDAKRDSHSFKIYDSNYNSDLSGGKAEMNRATMMRELFVNYQPIMNIEKDRIKGLEALVRWSHPTRGFIPPNQFIAAAEQNGSIGKIGVFVLEEICEMQDMLYRECGYYTNININVSVKELVTGFEDQFTSIIDSYNIPHSSINIEITESESIELSEVKTIITSLSKLGYKIYVDDFGTGYATLSYLKSLPIAGVKIDKSFIDNIDKCKRDLDMLKGVIGLIKTLELEVICEGVERLSQLNLLRELGVTNIQGFLYYRPMKGNEIVAELKHSSDKERKEVTTEDFIEELELNLARG